jgi:valyl-tRNA synthetase
MTLSPAYDHLEAESRWQRHWEETAVHAWDETQPRANTYVIDTPPPTVSGLLHMGHVFSYCHADFIARYQRMSGKTVFYPMGFDDNGLPTERLVEKTQKVRATDMSREAFIALCEEVSAEARTEFRALFESIALSVDWRQEYHTISEHTRRLSQASFLDLHAKEEVYRKLQPMLWDPVDQTAIAQAEVEDKELPSHFSDIRFTIAETGEQVVIGTTRPELIPACVALFYHPDDARYQHLTGKEAITPLFGIRVPILADETVEPDKGTGLMMCCTFGDEKDIEKWRKHNLPMRVVLNKYGKMDFQGSGAGIQDSESALCPPLEGGLTKATPESGGVNPHPTPLPEGEGAYTALQGLKTSNTDPKHPAARQKILEMLKESGDLLESKPITHIVKCAERSGAPLEILPTPQWFVKVLDKKEALQAKSREVRWYPEHMAVRMEQWIDGLNWDWCISRQRYFGVPFPVWYAFRYVSGREDGSLTNIIPETILARPEDLPINPLLAPPPGFRITEQLGAGWMTIDEATGERVQILPDTDVMDTWATSSLSPQISSHSLFCPPLEGGQTRTMSESGGVNPLPSGEGRVRGSTPPGSLRSPAPPQGGGNSAPQPSPRHALYPADLRPQAHEIIRTWAFYTLAKSHLHSDTVPWHNIMISGWCLASDKSKMSKSKGNTITPVELIREKGSDAVRFWASTAKLGTDTAFSEDVLKIGRKLVTKLWNAAKFATPQLERAVNPPATAAEAVASGLITEMLDIWLLSRIQQAVGNATEAFIAYDYTRARQMAEDVFWNDFCDNYLELIKARSYGEASSGEQGQLSAAYTLHYALEAILKLFAPFVPHITEELYQALYAGRGSVHARGSWPQADAYPMDAEALAAGNLCLEWLETVRKHKSLANLSIKAPLEVIAVHITPDVAGRVWGYAEAIAEDLKSACNAALLTQVETAPEGALPTLSGDYQLAVVFAASSEVA